MMGKCRMLSLSGAATHVDFDSAIPWHARLPNALVMSLSLMTAVQTFRRLFRNSAYQVLSLFIAEMDFDADHCRRVRRQKRDNLSKCFLPCASAMLPPR